MTLAFSWATNTNFSTGPDAGTPTKVDPASTANGFINGTIAAAQHVNFLFNGLATELVKAIDGVNGGTYTLGSVLRFEGADVQIAADLEVVSGGEINVQAGGLINVTGDIQVKNAGDINVESGGDIHLASGAGLELDSGAVFLLQGTQNVDSTGVFSLETAGAQMLVKAGTFISIQSSGSLEVAGIVNINSGGVQNVNSGGRIDIESGGSIDVNAGGSITIEDQNDLLINSDSVNVRMCMTPAWIESAGGAVTWDRTASSPGGALIQTQVDTTAQYIAMFPLALPPGDDILGVSVVLHGTIGSAGSHGALPALMPQIALISVDSSGTQTTIATVTDSSASTGAYDANHTVVLTPGSPETVSGSNAYYVLVLGEAGSNSQANSLGIRSIGVSIVARSFRGTGSSNIVP